MNKTIFTVLTDVVNGIGNIVALLLPVVFGLAILAFFWGILKYVWSKSGDDKVSGKNVMIWSLVAIFVMVSLFGIIELAQRTLGIGSPQDQIFKVPQIDGGNEDTISI